MVRPRGLLCTVTLGVLPSATLVLPCTSSLYSTPSGTSSLRADVPNRSRRFGRTSLTSGQSFKTQHTQTNKNACTRQAFFVCSGAPERIRTSDLCLRRAALYPAELRAQNFLYATYRIISSLPLPSSRATPTWLAPLSQPKITDFGRSPRAKYTSRKPLGSPSRATGAKQAVSGGASLPGWPPRVHALMHWLRGRYAFS